MLYDFHQMSREQRSQVDVVEMSISTSFFLSDSLFSYCWPQNTWRRKTSWKIYGFSFGKTNKRRLITQQILMSCNFPTCEKMCSGWDSNPLPLALITNVQLFRQSVRHPYHHSIRSNQTNCSLVELRIIAKHVCMLY